MTRWPCKSAKNVLQKVIPQLVDPAIINGSSEYVMGSLDLLTDEELLREIGTSRENTTFATSPAVTAALFDRVEVFKYLVQRLGVEPVVDEGVRHVSMGT